MLLPGFSCAFATTVTKEMLKRAKEEAHIKIDGVDTGLDKIQILTVEDLMRDKKAQLPNISSTFKKAQRKESKSTSYGLFD